LKNWRIFPLPARFRIECPRQALCQPRSGCTRDCPFSDQNPLQASVQPD